MNHRSLVLLLATAAAASAQPPETPQAPVARFGGEIRVIVVELPVSVVDGEGRPVTGLGREDFVVREDGREVEVVGVLEADNRPKGAVSTEEAPGEEAAAPPATAPSARPLALLFDLDSLERRAARRVVEGLEGLLDGGREVLVAVASDGRLEVAQDLTSDTSEVEAALATILEKPMSGEARLAARRSLERSIVEAPIAFAGLQAQPGNLQPIPGVERTIQEARRLLGELLVLRIAEQERIAALLQATGALVRQVGVLRRDAALLVVAQDVARQPALSAYTMLWHKYEPLAQELGWVPPPLWAAEVELNEPIERVAATAGGERVVVSTLDPSDRDREAAVADVGLYDVDVAVVGGEGWRGVDMARSRSLETGAAQLARETGGEHLSGTRDVGSQIDRLAGLLDHHYVVGYTRPSDAPEAAHTLEVRVPGRKVTVRSAERLAPLAPDVRLGEVARAALLLGAPETVGGLRLEPGLAARDGGGRLIQPLDILVPLRDLAPVPDTEDPGAQITAAVVVESAGGTSVPRLLRIGLSLQERMPYGAEFAGARVRLAVPEDARRVAVALRDDARDVTTVAIARLGTPPDLGPQPDAPAASPAPAKPEPGFQEPAATPPPHAVVTADARPAAGAVAFVGLPEGLILGPLEVVLSVAPTVADVELLLDGALAGRVRGAPWRTTVDLGPDPLPHEIEARALGADGEILGAARDLLNAEGAHASVEVLIEGCPEGVCTAGAVWSTFPPEPPATWRATVGGRRLEVEDPGRFSYRCRPPGTEILTIELDFPGGRVARTAVPCGGSGHVVSSDLTALPTVVEEDHELPPPERMAGWLKEDGAELKVVAVDSPQPEVFLVRDPSAVMLLLKIGEDVRFRSRPPAGVRLRMVSTRAEARSGGWPGSVGVFPVGAPFGEGVAAALPQELARVLGENLPSLLAQMDVSTPRRLEEGVHLSDAVAVAGLEAAATRAPRAVVLVLGPKPTDESMLTPTQARAFLEALRVPLYVWSIRTPEGTGWEATHDVSRSGSFLRAVVQLREAVMRQRMLWLEGMHLIDRVSLSDRAEGLTLLR